jgi:hypothetical protein
MLFSFMVRPDSGFFGGLIILQLLPLWANDSAIESDSVIYNFLCVNSYEYLIMAIVS